MTKREDERRTNNAMTQPHKSWLRRNNYAFWMKVGIGIGIGIFILGWLWSPLWIIAVGIFIAIGLVTLFRPIIQQGIRKREISKAKEALEEAGLYGKKVLFRCSQCAGLEEGKFGIDWIPLSLTNSATGAPYKEGDVMLLHQCRKCADQEKGEAAAKT